MNVSSASGRSSSQTDIYTVRFVSVSGINAAAYVSKKSPVSSPWIYNKCTIECHLLPVRPSIIFWTDFPDLMYSLWTWFLLLLTLLLHKLFPDNGADGGLLLPMLSNRNNSTFPRTTYNILPCHWVSFV